MTREQTDRNWHPYCLKCTTIERMTKEHEDEYPDAIYQYFKCPFCDAKHTRIFNTRQLDKSN